MWYEAPPPTPPWTRNNAQPKPQPTETAISYAHLHMTNDGDHDNHLNTHARNCPSYTPAAGTPHKHMSLPNKCTDCKSTPKKVEKLSHQLFPNDPQHDTRSASTTDMLSAEQHKYQHLYIGLMAPSGPALKHPVAPMLLELATVGCCAHIPTTWTAELLEAAIAKGAHPSALDPIAAEQLCTETMEKIAQGYARLVNWDSIKDNPPPNLKISPIATIPHKSKGYRMILDLSHGVKIGKKRHPSVNECTTQDEAPTHTMAELGNILLHLLQGNAVEVALGELVGERDPGRTMTEISFPRGGRVQKQPLDKQKGKVRHPLPPCFGCR